MSKFVFCLVAAFISFSACVNSPDSSNQLDRLAQYSEFCRFADSLAIAQAFNSPLDLGSDLSRCIRSHYTSSLKQIYYRRSLNKDHIDSVASDRSKLFGPWAVTSNNKLIHGVMTNSKDYLSQSLQWLNRSQFEVVIFLSHDENQAVFQQLSRWLRAQNQYRSKIHLYILVPSSLYQRFARLKLLAKNKIGRFDIKTSDAPSELKYGTNWWVFDRKITLMSRYEGEGVLWGYLFEGDAVFGIHRALTKDVWRLGRKIFDDKEEIFSRSHLSFPLILQRRFFSEIGHRPPPSDGIQTFLMKAKKNIKIHIHQNAEDFISEALMNLVEKGIDVQVLVSASKACLNIESRCWNLDSRLIDALGTNLHIRYIPSIDGQKIAEHQGVSYLSVDHSSFVTESVIGNYKEKRVASMLWSPQVVGKLDQNIFDLTFEKTTPFQRM